MSAFQDEIAGIFEDVKRYSMGDARIEECLEEAMKRITAEVDALAFEAVELERCVVNATSEREAARIGDVQPVVEWVPRHTDYIDWRSHGIA